MRRAALVLFALALASGAIGGPSEPDKSEEDLRREAAIAEFTAKMKAANYPALFDKAAQEFGVPSDILKGVAFAETRWDHLTWPPGETASPENGMPRPYGIMSLWDNQYFGHSLIEAATLIGKAPDELKQDPLLNIRGAAALLRKIYEANPKPEGTTEADIESWRNAIRIYCGIPEPEFNAQHALDVYVFMSQGYHDFGIEWGARPVNLEPMREETRRIVAEARLKREALQAASANQNLSARAAPTTNSVATLPAVPPKATNRPAGTVAMVPSAEASSNSGWWIILALVVVLAGGYGVYHWRRGGSA